MRPTRSSSSRVNQAAVQLYGYSHEEFEKMSILAIAPVSSAEKAVCALLRAKYKIAARRSRLFAASGQDGKYIRGRDHLPRLGLRRQTRPPCCCPGHQRASPPWSTTNSARRKRWKPLAAMAAVSPRPQPLHGVIKGAHGLPIKRLCAPRIPFARQRSSR